MSSSLITLILMTTLSIRNTSHNTARFCKSSITLTVIKALSLLIPRQINNHQSLKIVRFFSNLIINGFFGATVDTNDDRLHMIDHCELLVGRVLRISIDEWNHWQAPF